MMTAAADNLAHLAAKMGDEKRAASTVIVSDEVPSAGPGPFIAKIKKMMGERLDVHDQQWLNIEEKLVGILEGAHDSRFGPLVLEAGLHPEIVEGLASIEDEMCSIRNVPDLQTVLKTGAGNYPTFHLLWDDLLTAVPVNWEKARANSTVGYLNLCSTKRK